MSKLPNVGTTIFTTMSKLANDHNAINLSQGFPNFPIDPILAQTLIELTNTDIHQYKPMAGDPNLLCQVAALVENCYSRSVDMDTEILITAGATQAIFTSILALVHHGDEVIILDPSYDCYEPAVILAGGKPIRIPLSSDFLPDWERINDSMSDKTKMIITNNPHNPSGRVWKHSDMDQLEMLMTKFPQLLLLSDEVYEHITFESDHISAHEKNGMIDRSIIVSSFGKTFHITGWKIGYLVAPEKLMREIKKVHQFNVFCVNSVAQAALSTYMQKVDVSVLGDFYQKKRDVFSKLMSRSKFKLLPCEGTYFQTADYTTISDEADIDFCVRLTKEYGVATIPISVFNANGQDLRRIRFCFAKDDDTLISAANKLCKI